MIKLLKMYHFVVIYIDFFVFSNKERFKTSILADQLKEIYLA